MIKNVILLLLVLKFIIYLLKLDYIYVKFYLTVPSYSGSGGPKQLWLFRASSK